MRVLVTGASGFIGGAVTRALLDRGEHVRCLLRPGTAANLARDPLAPPPPLRGEVEVARGDLRDAESVLHAAKGCEAIFHVGALYSFAAGAAEVLDTNVRGTRNVLAAAHESGARLVYTSSIATVGGMHGSKLPDERDEHRGAAPGPYKQSKFEAEEIVRAEARNGLDAVIVNPTFPIGWGDVKPTPTGAMVRDFLEGRMPAWLDTGMNVVDVDDVAQGHLLALDKGVRGERYILGNENLTMRELLEELARVAGKKPPRFRMPWTLALALGHADALVEGRLLKRTPRIPLEGVRTARENRFCSPARAVRELGLPQTPIPIALEKAVRWFAPTSGAQRAG